MMCDKDCKVPTVYLAIFQLALRDKKKNLYSMHTVSDWENREHYQMLTDGEQKTINTDKKH